MASACSFTHPHDRTEDHVMEPNLRYDLPVYVAAARVRVTADEQLGIETPEAIRRLARGEVDARVREAVRRAGERRERAEKVATGWEDLKTRRDLDVYIAAAELRVATDRRLGIETPESIRRLARGEIREAVKRALLGEPEGSGLAKASTSTVVSSRRRRIPRGAKPRIRWLGPIRKLPVASPLRGVRQSSQL